MSKNDFYAKWLKDAKRKKPSNYLAKQLQLNILSKVKETNE